MRTKLAFAALVAAAGVLTAAVPARAGDTFRLGGGSSADEPTMTLGDDENGIAADTLEVGPRGYGYRGGYRGSGYRGGYRSYGYRGSAYRGYRPYYRPAYRSYYYPRYYYPRYYYGSYGPRYYYAPPVVYGYYYPAASTATIETPPATVRVLPQPLRNPSANEPLPRPKLVVPEDGSVNGTYQYDGGPREKLPMPKAEADDSSDAPPIPQEEGRYISLKSRSGKALYPAYGELLRPLPSQAPKAILTSR